MHNFPIIATTASIYLANIIFLESDWWLDFQTALLYLFTDYTLVSIYDDTLLPDEKIYYLDWST
jgi:hypothetical protein